MAAARSKASRIIAEDGGKLHATLNDASHNSFNVEFGRRLQLERKRLGLSGTQLALICGLGGASAQSQYERGVNSANVSYLRKCIDLGMDPMFLLMGSVASTGVSDPDLAKVIDSWRQISPSVKSAITTLVEALAPARETK